MHTLGLGAYFGKYPFIRIIYPILITLISSFHVFILGQNLKFEHLSIKEGLSQSNVICIFQDSRGFMWFGTRDGLNKYDGYKFTAYKYDAKNKNSLCHNIINDIKEDADGNLWIATWGGGLDMFNFEKDEFVHHKFNSEDTSSISTDHINKLLFDANGDLWIATEGGGLNFYDKKTKKFTYYLHDQNDPESLVNRFVKCIVEDDKQNLWLGTDGGLSYFDKKTKKFTNSQHDESKQGSLASNSVYAIWIDSKKRLWVGLYNAGLDLYDKEKNQFRHFKNNPDNPNSLPLNVVRTIGEDDKGNIWVGTENGGLSVLHVETETFDNYLQDYADNASISNNSIWSIYKDAKGNMWVGTFSSGVDFVNRDADKFKHYKHTSSPYSLSNNSVLAIFEDSKENIWVGTDGGGLNLYNSKLSTFKHYLHDAGSKSSICGNYILEIFEDSDGNLWIGTWGDGISIFNKERNTFKHLAYDPANPKGLNSPNVWTIFEDSEKNIWIGTYAEGVGKYNKNDNTFTYYKHSDDDDSTLATNIINVIFEDSRGNLWIGTNGYGLDLFDKKTQKFRHFKHRNDDKNGISNNDIYTITEDKRGNLWIGTNLGLNCMTPNMQFTCFYVEDGLPSNTIAGILEDEKGNLWVSSLNGISRFNPITKAIKNFEISDGLQASEFKMASCYKSKNGKMYFGGVNGFNEFFPDSIKEKNYDPPLIFTDFQIFNKQVPISQNENDNSPLKKSITSTNELILPYDQSVISFEFASLNYTAPNKKQYSYMLEGFDKNWNFVGTKHTATYTNLDPGKYTLRVRGLNNDGNWSKKILTIKLSITPPYWKTWWFKVCTILFAIGSIFSYYWYRMNAIQAQKAELERLVTARTDEVVKQKKDLEIQSTYLANINAELISQKEELVMQRERAEQAQLEAEQANMAKGVFLTTMSHEIRTPMNGVIGMASLLAETNQTQEQKEYTEIIRNSGDALLTVINDILDFSKIESGKMEVELKPFNLRNCIEEVLDVFASKTASQGLDLMYEIDFDVPVEIVGDSVRLKQVILNLVGNSVKFTHCGEIFIGVHLLKGNSEKMELSFEVRDTGIGIPPDKLNRLFKAFSQVDSSTTRKYGGTGLGLVISENLIKLMGGIILVESVFGQGTTFTFTIQTSGHVLTDTYMHDELKSIRGKRVLIIDDNTINRNILKRQLEHWNLFVTSAESAERALTILSESTDFDLALVDMQMPGMDGIQFAKCLRKRNVELPMILLSAVGIEHSQIRSELFSSVLTKPVKQHTLLTHVVAQLTKQPRCMESVSDDDEHKKILSVDFAKRYPFRILIAEDNLINMKLAERVLTKLGYVSQKAFNGYEAVKTQSIHHCDLILMDVQMPEMDGLEATRAIRAQSGIRPVIIAMTANAMQGDREICLQAGMDDYISKPIKLEDFVELIEKWFVKKA